MFRISQGQLGAAEPLLDELWACLEGPGVERLRAFALAGLAPPARGRRPRRASRSPPRRWRRSAG